MDWLMKYDNWTVRGLVLGLIGGAIYFYMMMRKKALGPQKPTQRGVIR